MNTSVKNTITALTGAAVLGVILLLTTHIHPGTNTLFKAFLKDQHPGGCAIDYPHTATIFPPEMPPPLFRWHATSQHPDTWLLSFRIKNDHDRIDIFTNHNQWRPSPTQWETIKKGSQKTPATLAIIGLNGSIRRRIISGGLTSFTTSEDSVGNPLFYREVQLPFSEAVKDPSRIRWRFGTINQSVAPRVVLENLPVCGNCHSFSTDGKTLGMDVDYANDKGSYAVTSLARTTTLSTKDIITWSDYKRDEHDPTFGLLSQISPDGRFVVSTVKDRSVFVAKPDITFSQLFFPIQGILATYSRTSGKFAALPGADDTGFVQSNPSWSPDGKYIVFARSPVYHLKNLHDKGRALLSPEECSEFLNNSTRFTYDLYRIPFNEGKGGRAEPLSGAAHNGMSNFFARYSPDGKWIVFCQSRSFMLLQPDSRLYIMSSGGGEPRLMKCNTRRMNSWHSWSSNNRWLVFASKENSPYTQLYITHIDTNGNDAPPVLLEHLTAPERAANIPEFVYTDPDAMETISEAFIDDVSLWRAGMAFEEAGDSNSAFSLYLQALKSNPNCVNAHISAGNILEKRGKFDEALAHYTQAATSDSTNAISRINRGNIFFQRGAFTQAAEQYTSALRLAPGNGFGHCNLAEAYVKLARYHEALAEFLVAQNLMPDDALARFGMGKVYATMSNYTKAITNFSEGVRLLPDDPDGYHLLANAMVKAGRRDEAIAVYKKALAAMPDSPELRLYLANLLQQ